MTLDEKLAQLGCLWSTDLVRNDPNMRFVTEPGSFTFSIGASSTDIRAEQAVTLAGEVAAYRQRGVVATRVAIDVVA